MAKYKIKILKNQMLVWNWGGVYNKKWNIFDLLSLYKSSYLINSYNFPE